jgi:hypothetical protein
LQVDACTQHRGKNDRLRISCVDFAGEIKVRDAADRGNALTQGIGHAKALGCGLLLVRRLGQARIESTSKSPPCPASPPKKSAGVKLPSLAAP